MAGVLPCYSREFVQLNNMPVLGSYPVWYSAIGDVRDSQCFVAGSGHRLQVLRQIRRRIHQVAILHLTVNVITDITDNKPKHMYIYEWLILQICI